MWDKQKIIEILYSTHYINIAIDYLKHCYRKKRKSDWLKLKTYLVHPTKKCGIFNGFTKYYVMWKKLTRNNSFLFIWDDLYKIKIFHTTVFSTCSWLDHIN